MSAGIWHGYRWMMKKRCVNMTMMTESDIQCLFDILLKGVADIWSKTTDLMKKVL